LQYIFLEMIRLKKHKFYKIIIKVSQFFGEMSNFFPERGSVGKLEAFDSKRPDRFSPTSEKKRPGKAGTTNSYPPAKPGVLHMRAKPYDASGA